MFTRLNSNWNRQAFTLLEMLVAMALTLLMMAALTRTFKIISDSMRESRVNVELSSKLRTISYRLNNELERVTVRATPPRSTGAADGYLVYHDGPMTDSTTIQSAIVGPYSDGTSITNVSRIDGSGNFTSYFPLSRYGDLDDYLAFTAVAEPGTVFRGIVPRFIVEFKEYELAVDEALRTGNTAPTLPSRTTAEWLAPVEITSRYAEIVYWLSPLRSADTNGDGIGEIIDVNGDFMPDRMVLRRRVLLIRPDLNIPSNAAIYTNGLLTPDTRISSNPNAASWSAGSLPTLGVAGGVIYMAMGDNPTDPSTGAFANNPSYLRPRNVIYQQCDLSVRRPMAATGKQQPEYGEWCPAIANSLSDLARPENRFAHIRVPDGYGSFPNVDSTRNNQYSSMPLLDLLGVEGLMAEVASREAGGTAIGADVSAKASSGFLNPIYELRDTLYPETDTFHSSAISQLRHGDDVILTDVLGFDVRAYDAGAPVFIHVGADGLPGDGGTVIGEAGSDDLVITPSDPGMYEISRLAVSQISFTGTMSSGQFAALGRTGEFVDLDYVHKSGGNILKRAIRNDSQNAILDAIAESPLSGFWNPLSRNVLALDNPSVTSNRSPWQRVPYSMWRSGKLVVSPSSENALIYQPTYDTWASDYESDGLNQGSLRGVGGGTPITLGTVWMYNTAAALSQLETYDPFNNAGYTNQADEGQNNLDDPGSFPGVDDLLEQEAPAPMPYDLPAIQIRVRVVDPTSQQIRQIQIVQDLPN